MQATRKLFHNPWLNRAIVAVFLLWSAMFVCLLPSPGQRLTTTVNSAAGIPRWHSDCLGGVAQTFCKSDGHTGALPSFPHLVGISSDLIYWVSAFVMIVPARIPLPFPLRVAPVPIFLIVCSFLK